ncbi:MAG: hypothetical protein DME19_01760 [Verrucomicrobia bacterium]|nr:MAG: hypothetical protein DME19_01760 [Verrucomicrobiota bacterium]
MKNWTGRNSPFGLFWTSNHAGEEFQRAALEFMVPSGASGRIHPGGDFENKPPAAGTLLSRNRGRAIFFAA